MKKLQSTLVLIKVDPVVEKVGSIYIQEEWQSLPPSGTVEMVGKDVTFCKKGDHVFFTRYSAIDVDKDLRLCRENDVLAIL
jgi:co-chaperonin GroES (HSP10)